MQLAIQDNYVVSLPMSIFATFLHHSNISEWTCTISGVTCRHDVGSISGLPSCNSKCVLPAHSNLWSQPVWLLKRDHSKLFNHRLVSGSSVTRNFNTVGSQRTSKQITKYCSEWLYRFYSQWIEVKCLVEKKAVYIVATMQILQHS